MNSAKDRNYSGRVLNPNPSRAYSEAVASQRKFLAREGLEHAKCAFGEAVGRETYYEFCEPRGWVEDQEGACIERLLGRPCGMNSGRRECPGHRAGFGSPTLWLKDGEPVAYVSQGYDVRSSDLKVLLDFCEGKGLEFEVTASNSWKCPGKSMAFIITRKRVAVSGLE